MLVKLGFALAIATVVVVALVAWRRPPRRLTRVDLRGLGLAGPAIVQFSTRYCAPCRSAAPHLRAAAERAGVRYAQVDVGERPDAARRHGIRSVPTIAVAGPDGRVLGVWTALPANGEIAEAARRARG